MIRLPTVLLVGLVFFFAGAFVSQLLDGSDAPLPPPPTPTPAAVSAPMPTLDIEFRDEIRDAQAVEWGDAYAECIDRERQRPDRIVKRKCRREADRVLP